MKPHLHSRALVRGPRLKNLGKITLLDDPQGADGGTTHAIPPPITAAISLSLPVQVSGFQIHHAHSRGELERGAYLSGDRLDFQT